MFTKVDLGRNTFSLGMDNTIDFASNGVKTYRKGGDPNGPLMVEGMPIFRSGTFRNSWGEATSWTDFHINQMVANFNNLKDSGIFADVPVRSSHPEPWFRNSTDEVIGYVTSLTAAKRNHPATGVEHNYLLANYEVTDPAAAAKIEKKTYRNRSAEVGMYVDNTEAEYYPVLMGFAYVDISAVEGLNFGKHADIRRYALDEEGVLVGDANNTDETEEEVVTPESDVDETPDDEIVDEEEVTEEVSDETPEETPVTEETPPATSTNSASSTVTDSFSVNFAGRTITSAAEAQALIDSLSGVVVEDRNQYVNRMFSSGRITAGMKDGLAEFTAGLSIDQWGQFRRIFEDSPVVPAIAFRTGTPDESSNEEVKELSQVVEHLTRALGEERVKETPSYQRLQVIKEGK